jgi:hypothetical protein
MAYTLECDMNELLAKIVEAHGGLVRWNSLEKVEATVVGGGGFFPFKGMPPNDSVPRRLSVWLHRPKVTLSHFGAPDQHFVFTAERVAVEKLDGTIVAERKAPRQAFAGHQMSTPWDPLHQAYFSGEAFWTYFTTPFLLTYEGVALQELEPWQEGTERWRVLRAQFPGSIETHSLFQDFFFGNDFRLRRHDYNVNVAGGFRAAQLTSVYTEANGIRLPTRRRAHTSTPDRIPIHEMLMVSIDISEVAYT